MNHKFESIYPLGPTRRKHKGHSQVADESDILRLEQQVFTAFLNVRNQHAPDYPFDTAHCCVLTASNNKKISLRIVIPTYMFENNNRHLNAFVLAFQDTWRSASDEDSALLEHIDTDVYIKNRLMRILGSCKLKDLNRPLLRAAWHEPSMVAGGEEFLIPNIGPNCIEVTCSIQEVVRAPSTPRSLRTCRDQVQSAMPQQLVDAVWTKYMQIPQTTQFEMHYKQDCAMIFRLERKAEGYCIICSMQQVRLENFKSYQNVPGVIACDKIAIQAESLYSLDMKFYAENTIVILDELSSLIKQMCSDKTKGNKHGLNLLFFDMLIRTVICLDADVTDTEVDIMKSLRSEFHVINNTFQQKDDKVVLFDPQEVLIIKVHEFMQPRKHIWISTTINHVDYVVGIFSTHSGVDVETCIQMMRRVRHNKSKTYLVHADATTNKKLPATAQKSRAGSEMTRAGCVVTGEEGRLPKNYPVITSLRQEEKAIASAAC
ncbi:MAG: hypothetical protein J3R72DRAFT_497082 [Linnemannia gamsii]|nr:MAG: hypothetical protein J3R72DRAFT_497082 [Linnemannia gamsii]